MAKEVTESTYDSYILLVFLSRVTDIEDEHPSQKEIPDLFFPVAQADVYECSTYAVVCRLKSSPTYTITSTGGLFSHPDYPGVMVTIPENAVAPESPFTLELKVGVFKKVHFSYIKTVLICGQIKSAPRLLKVIRFLKNDNLIMTSLVGLTAHSNF